MQYSIYNKFVSYTFFFRSDQSYSSHASLMPWPSIPYTDTTLRQDLTECFNVRGIPYLVLVDNNGNIITENGRAEITEDPNGLVKYIHFIWSCNENSTYTMFTCSIFHGENDLFIRFPQDCYQNFKVTQLSCCLLKETKKKN